MNKIDEFVGHFHSLNLKYVEKVKGFDPNGIFVEHLLVVGFNNSFINAILNEDGDNASGTPSHDTDDLETILNTNESYKQRGKGWVRKVPNPRLSRPRVQHLGAALQRPTQVRKSHTVLQVEEEIRTLPPEKLKVLINFP
jgi:hypothetical protein